MEVGAVKQAFNNELILMKKKLNQAKTQVIHKLTRKAKTLTDKKVPDKLKAKLNKKAESAVKEVLIIKKIKARDIAKFIITHTEELKSYLNRPVVDQDKACARLSLHKAMQDKYKFIRGRFGNVPIKDLFMSRQERLKIKKEAREQQKNKKKAKQLKKNENGSSEWKIEDINREDDDNNLSGIEDEIISSNGDNNDSHRHESDLGESDSDISVEEEAGENVEESNQSEYEQTDDDNDSKISDSDIPVKIKQVKSNKSVILKGNVQEDSVFKGNHKNKTKKPEKKLKNKSFDEKMLDDDNRSKMSDSDIPIEINPVKRNKANKNVILKDNVQEDFGVKAKHKNITKKPEKKHKNTSSDEKILDDDNDSKMSDSDVPIEINPVKSNKASKNIILKNTLQEDIIVKGGDRNINKKSEKKLKSINKNKSFNEKILQRKLKKDIEDSLFVEAKVVDPFFITSTGGKYMSVAEPRQPDEFKEIHRQGNRKLRRAVMFGHVPKIKPKQNQYENNSRNGFNKPNYRTKFNSDEQPADKSLNNRKTNFSDREPNYNSKTNFNDNRIISDEKPEKLHPSWEAKKRQSGILPFQGKKIVFDES